MRIKKRWYAASTVRCSSRGLKTFMGRLRVLSGRDICGILSRHGFVQVRQKGSHVIMQARGGDGASVTVPVPDHREVKIGTLLSIIRQSGLDRIEFEA
jgi:predicted RNA binding protein YcfA (HicA-like mRNA interferase family)